MLLVSEAVCGGRLLPHGDKTLSLWNSKHLLYAAVNEVKTCLRISGQENVDLRKLDDNTYFLSFRRYHEAGSIIVQEMLCAFEPINEYFVQSLLSFMIGWPRRMLTSMFTLDLAFPGVRLSTVLVCVLVVDLSTQIFDWTMEVMCGAMLATFGRVSVLARMKEVGAILRLTTIISGESIMNDKGAVFFVTHSTGGLRELGFPASSVAKFSVVSSVGAAALGRFLALAAVPVAVTIVIAVPDSSSLYTAIAAGTSGILWLVSLSLCLRLFSRNFFWSFLN